MKRTRTVGVALTALLLALGLMAPAVADDGGVELADHAGNHQGPLPDAAQEGGQQNPDTNAAPPAGGGAVGLNPDDNGREIYVCKYVRTPGGEERLKPGLNPIRVDANTNRAGANLPDDVDVTDLQIGDSWTDAQGRSEVVAPGADCGGVPADEPEAECTENCDPGCDDCEITPGGGGTPVETTDEITVDVLDDAAEAEDEDDADEPARGPADQAVAQAAEQAQLPRTGLPTAALTLLGLLSMLSGGALLRRKGQIG